MKHLEQASQVSSSEVACSTSILDKLHGGSDESWTEPDTADDKPTSVVCCAYCSSAVVSGSAYNVNSGVDKKCVTVAMIDVGCGTDAAAVTVVDVSSGPDDAASVVDVVDVSCGMEDLLQHSDDGLVPGDQFDRHTVNLYQYIL